MTEPLIEQIVAAVLVKLDALVTAGTLASAERPLRVGLPDSPGNASAYLYQDDPDEAEDQEYGFKTWELPLVVALYARPSDTSATPVDTTLNRLRAAVEKQLLTDPTFGGLAMDARVRAPLGFSAGDGAYDGVFVNLEVLFRTLENDPYNQS